VVITAVHGPGGELIGFAKVTRDMTERRRLQELENSSRRMNEFLAMLAHELRNPLAPIRNAVSIMQLETLHSPVLRNSRDVIDRQLTHMTRLVDDLLDVGRLSTGKIQLRKELVRFGEIVMRGVETARPVIEARHHTLRLDLPAEPVYVQCDPTRIVQVVQNLLVNAAKYTPDGGQIALAVRPSGQFVRTSVSDNGRGIEAAHLDRIFELFMQADTGTALATEGGLGIGLTLARSLVEMHGGSLEAASPGLGQGATFTFQLPQHAAATEEEKQPLQQEIANALPVLVVDDNRDAADSATDILRLLGNRVERTYSGPEALQLAGGFRPAVVMLDLAMPEMDGFETLSRLRQVPGLEQVFAIAMTGFGNEDDRRRTRAAGFDAHLTKPVELPALVELLDQARTRLGMPAQNA
jgi:CheY-like chemotaxis protein/nitrogen-specific signal transduction histidine kinase